MSVRNWSIPDVILEGSIFGAELCNGKYIELFYVHLKIHLYNPIPGPCAETSATEAIQVSVHPAHVINVRPKPEDVLNKLDLSLLLNACEARHYPMVVRIARTMAKTNPNIEDHQARQRCREGRSRKPFLVGAILHRFCHSSDKSLNMQSLGNQRLTCALCFARSSTNGYLWSIYVTSMGCIEYNCCVYSFLGEKSVSAATAQLCRDLERGSE